MRRRTALKALASASVGPSVVGCLGSENVGTRDSTDGGTTTTGGGCPTRDGSLPTCGGEWERVAAYTDADVRYGTAGGFELTVEPEPVALGDCATVRLTNRSDENRVTGIEAKYDVHRETAEGWRSVLFSNSRAYNDLGIRHRPGEGFVWQRRVSQSGLSVGGDYPVRACEPLRPGTYRFLYWGGAGSFDALAVRFEVRK